MRGLAALLAILVLLASAPAAFAHASLIAAEPADGATLSAPPARLRLDFNEPVSPLVLRLIAPDGSSTALAPNAADQTVMVEAPPPMGEGTYVLSWRVVSADGHPVGGAIVFSVGHPSAGTPHLPADVGGPLRVLFWSAKFALYLALFVGVGGAAFAAYMPPPRPGRTVYAAIMAAGLVAVPISLGLQGLDALGLPLSAIGRADAWAAGLATSYAATAIIAGCAIVLGLLALRSAGRAAGRVLAACAVAAIGIALAASGHASNAQPHGLTRPAVFLHGVCVALWIGALLPLASGVRRGARDALDRFSRAIPLPLAVLVATGVALAWVQLDRLDALWTTAYGLVLTAKLVAVAALLTLAAANRYVLVPRLSQGGSAAPALIRTMATELAVAAVILGLVALWRFTPPPRALAAGETTYIHFHDPRAMAEIDITPQRGHGAHVAIAVTDGDFRPIAAKEVVVAIRNSAAGIEPLRRPAARADEGDWRIEDFRIPVAGIWRMRVEILLSDFDKVAIEDNVVLPRAP
jgi:copper transport protein